MRSLNADGQTRLLSWRHVREFAVPASMIEVATDRRLAGDWAGACAAAHVDTDLDLRAAASTHGREFAALVRADLRRLAPDLLRWHLPRTTADGLLRPGLTVSLARHPAAGGVQLVVRTAPSWASAGQRISLALWDPAAADAGPHPRPRPDQRFRLDLHRHLWAAEHAAELRERCGADRWTDPVPQVWAAEVPAGHGHAVHRWRAEAAILRAADGQTGPVVVRLGGGRRLLIGAGDPGHDDPGAGDPGSGGPGAGGRRKATARREPVLPYAATWLPPDLELLHAGAISADRLHPLVAAALAPGSTGRRREPAPDRPGPRLVACCGETHRLGFVDGTLVPLDHGPEELRREELLARFGGPPLPCLRAVRTAARNPDCLPEIRTRLDHGDHTGARALVTGMLGPGAEPGGALRDAFADAAEGLIGHGLYRAGLAGRVPAERVPAGRSGSAGDRTGRADRHDRRPRRPRRGVPQA